MSIVITQSDIIGAMMSATPWPAGTTTDTAIQAVERAVRAGLQEWLQDRASYAKGRLTTTDPVQQRHVDMSADRFGLPGLNPKRIR